MNRIVGTWIGPSNETYEFYQKPYYAMDFPDEPPGKAEYSISGNILTLRVTFRPEDKEKINLTFSDDGSRVRFDWIDGTKRRWDGAKSVCLRRENTD